MGIISNPADIKLPTVDIPCPEVGGVIRLRSAFADELEGMDRRDDESPRELARRTAREVIGRFAIRENGESLFDKPEDAPDLPAGVASRINDAFYELNGFIDDSEPEGK
ncbi:MAG: hypothetical protein AAGH88_11155 [Planctomycetota bacterium]